MFEKPRNQRQRGLLELIWPRGLASTRVESHPWMDALIMVMPEAYHPGSNEGRLGLGLEAKNLPCEVFAGLVNAPFADSSAPQPSTLNFQPSTRPADSCLPRCLDSFSFPLHCRRPDFPCVSFIFSFAADRASLQQHGLYGLRAVVLPLFRPHLFGAV